MKYIQSLHRKKYREQAAVFLVEGEKMALELLQQDKIEIVEIFALEDWVEKQALLLKKYQSIVNKITARDLKKISTLNAPNQVLLIAQQANFVLDKEEINKGLSLYLDAIRDPGNMGTILRIADWFGIAYIFCSADCVEVFNPKVVQASMGAIFRVPIGVVDFNHLKNHYLNVPIYGMVLDGEDIFKTSFTDSGLIVIGNESRGISTNIQQQLDKKLTIPAFGKSGSESLNAGVATGIVCAAFRAYSHPKAAFIL